MGSLCMCTTGSASSAACCASCRGAGNTSTWMVSSWRPSARFAASGISLRHMLCGGAAYVLVMGALGMLLGWRCALRLRCERHTSGVAVRCTSQLERA